jgi:hypothetical protein
MAAKDEASSMVAVAAARNPFEYGKSAEIQEIPCEAGVKRPPWKGTSALGRLLGSDPSFFALLKTLVFIGASDRAQACCNAMSERETKWLLEK